MKFVVNSLLSSSKNCGVGCFVIYQYTKVSFYGCNSTGCGRGSLGVIRTFFSPRIKPRRIIHRYIRMYYHFDCGRARLDSALEDEGGGGSSGITPLPSADRIGLGLDISEPPAFF